MSNLLDLASIVLTPTAYNNGEALCIKPDDASGDFDFSRATEATRVNSQGLVETIGINLPRINYEGFSYDGSGNVVPDSGCGSWLFEPQSTNLITQSELFSDSSWSANSDVIIDKGYLAPDGTNNASKITANGANAKVAIFLVGTGDMTKSIYARTVSGTGTIYLGEGNTGGVLSNVTEQWQRFEVTNTLNNFYGADFRGASTLTEVIIWGAQFEDNISYATSYIPTSGSTVTRNQDLCTNGGSLASINSTEGVLYAEVSNVSKEDYSNIALTDGTNSQRVQIYFNKDALSLMFFVRVDGVLLATHTVSSSGINYEDTNKIAIKYKTNDISFWLNGIKVGTSTSGTLIPNKFTQLGFNSGAGGAFYGKTKAVAVWKEALSDSELQSLTTI